MCMCAKCELRVTGKMGAESEACPHSVKEMTNGLSALSLASVKTKLGSPSDVVGCEKDFALLLLVLANYGSLGGD